MGFNIHKSLGVTPLKSLVMTGFLSVSAVFAASYPPTRDTTGTGLAMTSSPYATAIGKAVLDNGGNAIDAAVAVGYALAGGPSCCRKHRWWWLCCHSPCKW